jgi:hypothetical protein
MPSTPRAFVPMEDGIPERVARAKRLEIGASARFA